MPLQNTTAATTAFRRNIGPGDPIYIALAAQNQVSVTPKRNTSFSFDGQWWIMVTGQTETVPQTIADIMTQSGVI